TLKTLRIFRGVPVASLADILTTALRVIDRASDAFPPLKSAVGGALALKDVTQAANASKARAQQLRQRISKILDRVPSDSTDVADDLEMLRHKVLQLDELSGQSFVKRLKNLNRNNEFLSTSQTDVEHTSLNGSKTMKCLCVETLAELGIKKGTWLFSFFVDW
ncbi:hypothetical protein K435DRAFT_814555, partial [Dendrothele bispora CBS 962.96]